MNLARIFAGTRQCRPGIAARWLAAATLLGSIVVAQTPVSGSAQQASGSTPDTSSSQRLSDDTGLQGGRLGGDRLTSQFTSAANGLDQSDSLSPDQIVEYLEDHPEQLETAKRLTLNWRRQLGQDVSIDTFTTEDLYDALENDADLRTAIARNLAANVKAGAGEASLGLISRGQLLDAGFNDYPENDPTSAVAGPIRASGQPRPASLRVLNSRSATSNSQAERSHDPAAPAVVHRHNPHAGLQSLRDLYTQFNTQEQPLHRFGLAFFSRRSTENPVSTSLLDLPAGPDYVLGPGDRLTVSLSGGMMQRIPVAVDPAGRIPMADAGMLEVAGKTIGEAQTAIERALTPYYSHVRADLSLSRMRSIRVYVVGEVEHPGAYDVSSLSTALNALVAAGGPTARGSFRTVKQYRGKQLVADVDFYDFFLHGIRSDVQRLQSGDSILVPPVGPQVTVAGMVRRPAIYEIRNENDLADAIDLAGGLLVSATLQNVKVERTEAHERRAMLSVNLPDGSSVEDLRKVLGHLGIQDGDYLTLSPIQPYTSQVIYVQGHVTRPGKYAYRQGMDVGQIIRSYNDVLPEPADRAEIIRLDPPDYHPRVIDFDLKEVLDGSDPVELHPLDTVRIYGRYQTDAPMVSVKGEVNRPGDYPLEEGMTAADLVRMAGGFTRSALTNAADVASYVVESGRKVRTEHVQIAIGNALAGVKSADLKLKPGDMISIRQLAGWGDIGASITITGEVRYPGAYSIEEGERLSSVIQRAGGFRETAFPAGAMLERVEVKQLAEKSRDELIHRIEAEGPSMKLVSSLSGQDQAAAVQVMAQQQQQALSVLRQQPATGRLVIKISADVHEWENTPADIELRPGDQLLVPKKPNFVLVDGQVYSPSAITFAPRKTAEWYLRQAGGPTDFANRNNIFVIRANGAVLAGDNGRGFWKRNVLGAQMKPGDTIVVPEKIVAGSVMWKNLLNTAQFMSSLALAARVVTSF